MATALGGICTHLARKVERYQPSNITWAHLPSLGDRRLKKRDRYEAMAERALVELEAWMPRAGLPAGGFGAKPARLVGDAALEGEHA
jgi:methylenetetrahydrofolate--tRNA-(uracil-5-)-methyltransferase